MWLKLNIFGISTFSVQFVVENWDWMSLLAESTDEVQYTQHRVDNEPSNVDYGQWGQDMQQESSKIQAQLSPAQDMTEDTLDEQSS